MANGTDVPQAFGMGTFTALSPRYTWRIAIHAPHDEGIAQASLLLSSWRYCRFADADHVAGRVPWMALRESINGRSCAMSAHASGSVPANADFVM